MATFQETIEELEGKLVIDKNKLDDELIHQPELFYEAGYLHVRAASKADQCKNERDQAYGRAAAAAREQLMTDQGKATDKAVEALAEQNKEYQTAVRDYVDACRVRDRAEVLKDAFKQRSYMLDPLCSLQATAYASTRSAGGSVAARREHEAETVRKGMAEERKAKNKRD